MKCDLDGPESSKRPLSSLQWLALCASLLVTCLWLAACAGGAGAVSANSSAGGNGSPANSGGGSGSAGSGGSGSGSSGGSGSGGSGGSSAVGPVIYVAETTQNFGTGSQGGVIEAFALNGSSGALTSLAGSPFSTNYSTASDMALAPSGASAYVLAQQYPAGTCCVGPTYLLVFALDAAGAPSFQQALPTSATEVGKLAVAPSGRFVYATPYSGVGNGGIGIFAVRSDGTLAASGVVAAQSSGDLVITPNGAYVYTNSDGNPVTPLGNNPCGLFNSYVWGFSINATTGALTPVSGSPFTFQRQLCTVGPAPNYLTKQIDPSGQRLFVVDSFNADVTVFSIDSASGALTLLPGTTTDGAVAGFTSSAMDPLGPFLYIGSTIDYFTGFSLAGNAASGILPLLAGMPVQVAPLPNVNQGSTALAIDSSGSFLFSNENDFTSAFSCCGPDNFAEFAIDSTTGALTQLHSAPPTLAGTASRIVAAPPR